MHVTRNTSYANASNAVRVQVVPHTCESLYCSEICRYLCMTKNAVMVLWMTAV